MKKAVELAEEFIENNRDKREACLRSFDEIFRILNEAKPSVDIQLAQRKRSGDIKNEQQALKSIAGHSFSKAVIYIFLRNKEFGNIRPDIFITGKKSKVPSFERISVINIGKETQKPDCDLVIYSLNNDRSLRKCMILSLKTSLREGGADL